MTDTFSPSSTQLFIDGFEFYPAIFDAINNAEQCIQLENYLVDDGELWKRVQVSLFEAADRGVRVSCIFDAFGSYGVYQEISQLNAHPNIEVKLFNPIRLRLGSKNLHRTHIKLFVIDQKLAFTGGAGITDDFYNPQDNTAAWSEVMVRVEGPSVFSLSLMFDANFKMIGKKRALFSPLVGPSYSVVRKLDGWLYAHHFSTHWIKKALYRQLGKAEERIWINSAYFFPTRKTIRYLVKKANAGVDVRLLLPGKTDVLFMKYLARGRYKKLLGAGVSIHELNDRFLHSKVVIIDDWATVGSFNLDVFSFRFNRELNYASTEEKLVTALEGFFLAKLQSAYEINLHEWTNRKLLSKVFERLAYGCALMLEKLIK